MNGDLAMMGSGPAPLFAPPPSMPSVKRELLLALADRSPLRGGGWSPEDALDAAHIGGVEQDVRLTLAALKASHAPADRDWVGDRLTILWADFMASRPSDPEGLTVWLIERIRLLDDIPHDILALSIDTAIKTSRHGFIPSVGEIRAVADPLVSDRERQIERLSMMAAAQADPDASAERERRWEDRRRHNAAEHAHG